MAIERPTINLTPSTNPTEELKKAFKARIAKVVTRGYLIDRLNVDLPSEVYGEWVSDDPVAIAEAQALGFEIDKEFAAKSALHSNAAGQAKVGDVVFMTMPKWQHEIIQEAKKAEIDKFHGVRGSKPAEETQYASNISNATPIINDSKLTNSGLPSLIEGS